MAASMKMAVFWVVALCSLVKVCSVASRCVMLNLVDTYQSLSHTHSSQFGRKTVSV
jgi:hypothetical protein